MLIHYNMRFGLFYNNKYTGTSLELCLATFIWFENLIKRVNTIIAALESLHFIEINNSLLGIEWGWLWWLFVWDCCVEPREMDQLNTIEPARVAGPAQDPRGDDWAITNFPRSVYSFTSVYT